MAKSESHPNIEAALEKLASKPAVAVDRDPAYEIKRVDFARDVLFGSAPADSVLAGGQFAIKPLGGGNFEIREKGFGDVFVIRPAGVRAERWGLKPVPEEPKS